MSDIKQTDKTISVKENKCKNCGYTHSGPYCNECGQIVITNKYTISHLWNIAFSIFGLQRGVLYTARCLFTNPGKVINDYLNGKTRCYYNPISYLLVIASIYAVLMVWFNLFDTNLESMTDTLGMEAKQTKLQSTLNLYIKKYLSFVSILILPFYSIASKWMFKKHKLNYAEHLIINSYAIAQYLLIFTTLIFIFIFFPSITKFMMIFGIIILLSYYTYLSKGIYSISWVGSFLRSVAVIIIGLLLFYLFIIILSIIAFIILHLYGVNLQEYTT